MKDLKDTVELMLSDKWQDRLMAEIYQCQIRKSKLEASLATMPKDDPTYEMLNSQYIHMIDYLVDLQSRAAAFGLELDSEYGEPIPIAAQPYTAARASKFDPMFWTLMCFFLAANGGAN